MVVLVWSASGLPTVTKAVDVPDDAFWLVWSLLPSLTKVPIWVRACRAVPLPNSTSARTHNTQYGDYVLCGVIMD